MDIRLLLITIYCVVLSSAVKLPGPCPAVPPTYYTVPIKHLWSTNPEILSVAPFSTDTPSYLFYDMKGTFISNIILEARADESDFLMHFRLIKIDKHTFLMAEVDNETNIKSNNSITLKNKKRNTLARNKK